MNTKCRDADGIMWLMEEGNQKVLHTLHLASLTLLSRASFFLMQNIQKNIATDTSQVYILSVQETHPKPRFWGKRIALNERDMYPFLWGLNKPGFWEPSLKPCRWRSSHFQEEVSAGSSGEAGSCPSFETIITGYNHSKREAEGEVVSHLTCSQGICQTLLTLSEKAAPGTPAPWSKAHGGWLAVLSWRLTTWKIWPALLWDEWA